MVEQLSVSPDISMSTLERVFGPNLMMDHDLAPLSSYRTGGKAKYFLQVKTADEVYQAVTGAQQLKIQFAVIGGGSNLLVSDLGFDGLVIKIAIEGIKLTDEINIESGAGEDLQNLVNFATDNSLSGLEFAAGIWGTVGGAIFGNAGAYGSEICNVITDVTHIDIEGDVKKTPPEKLGFEYRKSIFSKNENIIISARFKLSRADKTVITKRVNEILNMRQDRLPTNACSAGCFFRNIPDDKEKHGKLPAGRLLEEIGAKKLCVGGASVSSEHANIIVNNGHATSKDIRQLADIMKEKVFDKFGIELQEEIRQLGVF